MPYQWRAWVGPRYNHYDWPTLPYGSTVNLDFYRGILTSAMTSGTTTIALNSASFFPNAGGVWVGPDIVLANGVYAPLVASPEAFEYIQYTGKSGNNLTGCVREAAGNSHDLTHSIGQIAYFWYLIHHDDGTLRFSRTYDSTLTAVTMEGQIRGYLARHWLLRNNHLIAIQIRNSPTADWTLELLGVIDAPNWRDDSNRQSQWSIKIRSMEAPWSAQKVKGVRIGKLDIAKDSEASSTTPLILASDEADSGDYVSSAPEFGADKAVDGDKNTLWIADRFVGTPSNFTYTNSDGRNNGALKFSQVYMNPPLDAPPGARWVELIKMSSSPDQSVWAADGTGDDVSVNIDIDSMGTHDLLIICENEEVFHQLNPHAAPAEIIESAAFFAGQLASSGEMMTRWASGRHSWVAWGTNARVIQNEDIEGTYGTRIAAPGPGETLRYNHDWGGSSNSWEFWEVGKVRSAGYAINTSPDEWIAIRLPGLGLHLKDDIEDDDPGNGEKLYIVDAAGNPTTSGMTASGTIQIGTERIAYQSKAADGIILAASGARGASSTTAAGHAAGDEIFLVESGIVTDAHTVESIAVRRYGGTEYWADFSVYTSAVVNPSNSGDDTTNYVEVQGITGGTSDSWEWVFASPTRCKSILFRVEKMTANPGRPRVNEIEAILDPSLYLSALWLENGSNVQALLEALMSQAGMPLSALGSSGEGLPALSDLETAADAFWTVAVDAADYAGCRLTVGRVGAVSVEYNNFWTGTPSYSFTWNSTNIAAIEKSDRNDLTVSQVKLPWRTPDGSDKGEVLYPSGPGPAGEILELEEQIYTSSSAALSAAVKRFYLAHWPWTVVIEASAGHPTMEPGEVHRVQWTWHLADGVQERLYLVTGVDHWIEDGAWNTTVYLQQIERQVGY